MEEIGNTAFASCSLTSVDIPSTLTTLSETAFQDNAGGQVKLYTVMRLIWKRLRLLFRRAAATK